MLDVRPTVGSNRFDYALGVQEAFLDYHIDEHLLPLRFLLVPGRHPAVQPRFPRLPVPGSATSASGCSATATTIAGSSISPRSGGWRRTPIPASTTSSQTPRRDWVLHANVYRQDFPFVGLTSELSLTWNINRERNDIEVDDNGFPVRPALIGNLQNRNYDAFYIGYNADGRIGRMNISASAYGLFGSDRNNIFTGQPARIEGFFAAVEPSYDFELGPAARRGLVRERRRRSVRQCPARLRRDHREPDLRRRRHQLLDPPDDPVRRRRAARSISARAATASSTICARPRIRASRTSSIRARCCSASARISTSRRRCACRSTPTISGSTAPACWRCCASRRRSARDIGWDLSAAVIWRPSFVQNVVFRASAAVLQPGERLPRPVRQCRRTTAVIIPSCSTRS